MRKITQTELDEIIRLHGMCLRDERGGRHADLREADLRGASLLHADLARADLCWADLCWADLREANLTGANLRGADLRGANLCWADLLATGNMQELRTMQIDTWRIGYTADTLQIGCKRHPIAKWREWNTPEGREWIKKMAPLALAWADRNLALVLALIDANPATPTGHEVEA